MKKNILSIILLLSCLGAVEASASQKFETAHPYLKNEDVSGKIGIPGASCMTVTLKGELEKPYDFITVNGTQYTGRLKESFRVQRDSIDYHFKSDYSITKKGIVLKVSACHGNKSNQCITRKELETKIYNGEDVTEVNTSCITNMSELFRYREHFNQDISSWDVSNVTSMAGMFYDAKKFNQPLNDWNVSKVTNMGWMFKGAKAFNQSLNNWNTSKVTNMGSMFRDTKAFNQPLNDWNVSNVTTMSNMFCLTDNFNQPLNNWNVSKVTNMQGMFLYAINFNQNISGWDVDQVKHYWEFSEESALESKNNPFF